MGVDQIGMSYFMIDVETDGWIPGTEDFSMISLGAIVVEPSLSKFFYGKLRPISDRYDPEALKVSGHTREETLSFPLAIDTMNLFDQWISETNVGKRPMFVSDNNGFDYMFVAWYFRHFLGKNPFGHSSTNLGSLYKGLVGNTFKNFKHLRSTKHTHYPVDDAKGNAEALLHMKNVMGLNILLE
jgi:hypothetical protein